MSRSRPTLSLVLHTHLPWVLHHGRWPHGSDWLCEAVAESYLPLLRVFERHARPGRSLGVTLGLTPVLCEQLAHPDLVREFRAYATLKREAAIEDRKRFAAEGRESEARQAARWERFYRASLEDFLSARGGNLVARFRSLAERGAIEVITSGATHGYLPLLGTPAAVERQVDLARRVHRRHFGSDPRGFWLPECAYRPGGAWTSSVDPHRVEPWRPGLERVLGDRGIRFFFVDRHLIAGGRPLSVYADLDDPMRHAGARTPEWRETGIDTDGAFAVGDSGVACFGRDESTAQQVWSREAGYPGDPAYLEFHKRHHPGGLRYWAVTRSTADLADKSLYDADAAARRAPEHAEHFLRAVAGRATAEGSAPHACAMYDTELFGHWWFEGPAFLDAVLERADSHGVALAAAGEFLDVHGARGPLALPEGSWGAGGVHRVWLQPETTRGWRAVHETERAIEGLRRRAAAREPEPLLVRLCAQAERECLLLEASDWPFLVTAGTARDYAEARMAGHAGDAARLMRLAERRVAGGPLTDREVEFLAACEARDSLFPELSRPAARLAEPLAR